MTDHQGLRTTVRQLVRELEDVERCLADDDPESVYRFASRLAELLKGAAAATARHRGDAVCQVRDAGNLSLAEVAAVLHISKTRAAQFVNAASVKVPAEG